MRSTGRGAAARREADPAQRGHARLLWAVIVEEADGLAFYTAGLFRR